MFKNNNIWPGRTKKMVCWVGLDWVEERDEGETKPTKGESRKDKDSKDVDRWMGG